MAASADADDGREIGCLALTIYHEARGESERGKLAVGHVVMNRTRSVLFPASVCDVVRQGGQQRAPLPVLLVVRWPQRPAEGRGGAAGEPVARRRDLLRLHARPDGRRALVSLHGRQAVMVEVVRAGEADRSTCLLSRRSSIDLFRSTHPRRRRNSARALRRRAPRPCSPAAERAIVGAEPRRPPLCLSIHRTTPSASIIRVPGEGVTAMEEVKLWWLVLLVALLGGVGMALGG